MPQTARPRLAGLVKHSLQPSMKHLLLMNYHKVHSPPALDIFFCVPSNQPSSSSQLSARELLAMRAGSHFTLRLVSQNPPLKFVSILWQTKSALSLCLENNEQHHILCLSTWLHTLLCLPLNVKTNSWAPQESEWRQRCSRSLSDLKHRVQLSVRSLTNKKK